MTADAQFDRHAATYDADLNRALSATGEDKNYFAQGRVHWLGKCLNQLSIAPRSAIDYGCGVGDTSALLKATLGLDSIVGLDVSVRSLDIARLTQVGMGQSFQTFEQYRPDASVDLAYCNGVFHHIPVEQRSDSVAYIYRCLRPRGIFSFWENNPRNPGTRYVMSQCVFDEDAIPILPGEAQDLLRDNGFEILSVDFLFFFPRFLKGLRLLEPYLARLPLGAQYQILCQKPGT